MGTIPVQLTLPAQHKSQNVDFPDTATWSDVRKKALEWSKLNGDKVKVGIRGREIDDNTPLSELKSTHRKLQAQVTMRPKKNLTDDNAGGSVGGKSASSGKSKPAAPKTIKAQINGACAGLFSYGDQVETLEEIAKNSATDWDANKQKQLLGLNEYLERMLIALDGFTGLDADDHAHKKAKIAQINDLLARIDVLKKAGLPSS